MSVDAADADEVLRYYAATTPHERDRLLTPEGCLERVLTTRLLEPHLGRPGVALALGDGTGPYSVWLAELGWDVTLADVTPGLLAVAREKLPPGTVREVVEGGARDLSRWPADAFDAVLALGPSHHLTSDDDRARAAREVARVTRPGGLVAVGARTATVRTLFEAHGFSTVTLAATHGFLTGAEDGLEELRLAHPDAYLDLLDRLVATADDPAVLGTAGHLLYVGRRQR